MEKCADTFQGKRNTQLIPIKNKMNKFMKKIPKRNSQINKGLKRLKKWQVYIL